MLAGDRIAPEEHRRQIEAYLEVRPVYVTYAAVLRRVLKKCCQAAFPEALVQSRAKTVSSFAEKCVRQYAKYKDAVDQFTDLCGGRVVVQTNEQARAVCEFIEANFKIVEKDDKKLLLSEDQFGYRDTHYIIELHADRSEILGISDAERNEIGSRQAELQIRTWLQHAWADTLHDRIYKNELELSFDIRRTNALLAAIMEEGDRTFDTMAQELDDMIANYGASAEREKVQREIDIQTLVLENEPDLQRRPALALKLARLLAAGGEYQRVVELLDPYRDTVGFHSCEILQELGFAVCNKHSAAPRSADYHQGRLFLENALSLCQKGDFCFVMDLCRRNAIHARSLSRLGRVLEPLQDEVHLARHYLREASEYEPDNPYYLADMLGFEMYCNRQAVLPAAMRTAARKAVATCCEHAERSIELPYAFLTAGRLDLLLDRPLDALGYYARGVRHLIEGKYCVPPNVMEREIEWLKRLHFGQPAPKGYQWVLDFLTMAERLTTAPSQISPRKTLIVTGGAASADNETLVKARPLLEAALRTFSGLVVSGGTRIGIPGSVGEVASELKQRNSKDFELVGYIPKSLPYNADEDDRYDRLVVCRDDRFSPEQVLRYWSNLLDTDGAPTDIVLLGIGGGPISGIEYRLALALGATVAVVAGTGGEADAILGDKLWSSLPTLLPLPNDAASVRALVASQERPFSSDDLEQMGKAFHAKYVSLSMRRLPANMKPWSNLPETYRRANLEQARYAVEILAACGFGVRPAPSPVVFAGFDESEIEEMAELEHGRWNVDRLRDGWRPGPRNDDKHLHDNIVCWADLPEDSKKYDRAAVCEFPKVLATAGLEVYRR